jgi:acetolactate synthase-1/2/3 large subunit
MAPLIERSTGPITVERLCTEITKALPADGVLVADTGYSGIWTGTMIDFNGAGQTYLRAAGSLGWAFPAALGAQCAAGPRRVVCFTGDGGFYYHLAELEAARRYRIPSVTVINNNSGFGQNLTGVHRLSGNRPGRGEELIRFGPTDFTKVAASFGVRGIRVEQPGEIASALATALAADEPIVVDVVTELEPRAPEAWSPPR